MKPWPVVFVTLGLGIVFFLASPLGPLGGFWRPYPLPPALTPTQIQVSLFVLLHLIEALVSAFGVAFLIFGYPLVRAVAPASGTLTRLAHLAIAWVLINWWPHDSLHVSNGINPTGLLRIDYGFHVTLMAAGLILAYFFLTILHRAPGMAAR